jgi:signal transduction histidine kinase
MSTIRRESTLNRKEPACEVWTVLSQQQYFYREWLGLTAGFMDAANQRQEAALLRMQVISEMNHHIRNALGAVSLTTDSIQNQQCVRVISESADRIEWTLRELLLRRKPSSEKDLREILLRRKPISGKEIID